MVAATAVAPGPRYAPHDPTLPEPWKALVDGSTGYLYYWNPETNVTQYEKPVPPPPPLPAGPPPAISTPKLAPIPTGPALQGQQASAAAGSAVAEDNRAGRMGNEQHSDANKNGGVMTGQPKLAAIPVIRNQQGMGAMHSSHGPARHANGSGVSQPVSGGVPNMYKHVPSGHNYSNPNQNVSHRMHGSSDLSSSAMHGSSGLPNSAAVEAYRRQHEVSASGENVPAPFMTFDATGFPPEILRELQNAGFTSPTPIQAQSWPIALQNRDIVAIAKTGSGKTLGYLLPAFLHLRRCRNNSQMGPTVLVLSPTRELATQIQDEAIKFGRSSRISCTCLYGGAPKGPQLRELERGADLVVATPGRLNDILEMGKVSLRQVSFLVLDEADRMLDMGFEPQIRKIVKETPPRRQTLMYTATWPKDVRKIAGDLLVNPVQVTIGDVDELSANKSITQYVEVVPPMEKHRRVEHIVRGQEPGSKIIIFCSTKKMCDQLARSLGRQFGAAAIHGDKSQGERDWVLQQFRTGRSPVLVATDVAARGLDIKDIRVVINFDFPTGVEDYVHRIGRTGRAGATGLSYTFFSDQDAKYAPDLIKVLEGANQRVPQELREMASRCGNFNKGRPGRWDYGGGRGGRDGGRGMAGGRGGDAFAGRGGPWGGIRAGGRPDRPERGYGGFGGRDRYERYDGFDTDGRDKGSRHDRYMRDGYNRRFEDRDRGRSYSRSPSKSRARYYSRSRSRSLSHDRYGGADRYNAPRARSPARFDRNSPVRESLSPRRRSRSPASSFSPRRGGSPYTTTNRNTSPTGRSGVTTNRSGSPSGRRSPYYPGPCMEDQAAYNNDVHSSPPPLTNLDGPKADL